MSSHHPVFSSLLTAFADIIKTELSFLDSLHETSMARYATMLQKPNRCPPILFSNSELHSPRPMFIVVERLTSIERTVQYSDFAEGKEKS
jgi:hypothetical protein